MIVGRALGSTFPPKANEVSEKSILRPGPLRRKVQGRELRVSRGEIIGVAGVAGNGQSELMRALAGLLPSIGEIHLGGRSLKQPRASARSRFHALGPARRRLS